MKNKKIKNILVGVCIFVVFIFVAETIYGPGNTNLSLEEKLKTYGTYRGGVWAVATEERVNYGLIEGSVQHLVGNIVIVQTKDGWGAYTYIGGGGVYAYDTLEKALTAMKNAGVQ